MGEQMRASEWQFGVAKLNFTLSYLLNLKWAVPAL